MTTINNLTIEQMREIVNGAPDEASFYQQTGDQVGYILDGGGIYWWWNSQDNSWNKDYSDKRTMQSLNDLRTAISEHDSREFKVGDLVVNSHGEEIRLLKIWRILDCGHDPRMSIADYDSTGLSGWSRFHRLRHATPSEIKAGHRLEAERHG